MSIESFMGRSPLILDFDDSVLSFEPTEYRVNLSEWQERIRFGCSWRAFSQFESFLKLNLPKKYGCVFIGSGDFHHITLLLLHQIFQRNPSIKPFDLIVCDNHPDNMRYLFGVHCGSWVSHAVAFPFIRHVHVIGICSEDISFFHAWENHIMPFVRRKLTYWSLNKDANWLKFIQRREYCKVFLNAEDLIDAFLLDMTQSTENVYFSLDKDVLSPDVVKTNWDQGVFKENHLELLITALRHKLIGVDICGDVSEYTYKSYFKNFLSRLDGQENLTLEQTNLWKKDQKEINRRFFNLLFCS